MGGVEEVTEGAEVAHATGKPKDPGWVRGLAQIDRIEKGLADHRAYIKARDEAWSEFAGLPLPDATTRIARPQPKSRLKAPGRPAPTKHDPVLAKP